jgi:hypothetical protein
MRFLLQPCLLVASVVAAATIGLETRDDATLAAPTPPGYDFLYTLTCTLGASTSIGNSPRGQRTVIPITGGSFEGPNIKGTVDNLGADWIWNDSKGIAHPDTRYGLTTNDGAHIFIQTFGSSQSNGLIYLHGLFETGSDKYWYLNNVVAVGILKAGTGTVTIDMWTIKA